MVILQGYENGMRIVCAWTSAGVRKLVLLLGEPLEVYGLFIAVMKVVP